MVGGQVNPVISVIMDNNNNDNKNDNNNNIYILSLFLANSKPFSLLEQPLTAFAKISYGKQDYATVISSNWEKEQWQIKPALLKMML